MNMTKMSGFSCRNTVNTLLGDEQRKNENICHAFKKIQKETKGKRQIFDAQAFKSITKGKTILHIVCRARGQRNCDFHSETVELSSSCDKCAHPISFDHVSTPPNDWMVLQFGSNMEIGKVALGIGHESKGEQGEGKSSWGQGQVSQQPYCTEIISSPPNRDEFKIICCIRGAQ